jgi:hypothetical protein
MLEVVDLYFSQNRRNILKGISFKAINPSNGIVVCAITKIILGALNLLYMGK